MTTSPIFRPPSPTPRFISMSHSHSMVSLTSFANVRRLATSGPRQIRSSKPKRDQRKSSSSAASVGFGGERKDPLWQCVEGCGACCKLDKGPTFATPEEIFEDPCDIQLYRSLIGSDGWCINYEKGTRTCSIYSERPYFCRVEPDVFQTLYGIDKKKFNREACSCCRDTIKEIYGPKSKELENFNHGLRSGSSG